MARTMMNNFLAQTTAVGVIALVTMFPSPDRFRDAIIPTSNRVEVAPDQPSVVLVDSAAYDDATIELSAPFDMTCVNTKDGIASLGGCAGQLWVYIKATEITTPSEPSYLDQAEVLDPHVEQARRTLVEICRLRWAMENPPKDPATDAICQTLL